MLLYKPNNTARFGLKLLITNSQAETTVSVLGLLAARDGSNEAAMGRWGLGLGIRYPSRTSLMSAVILKCQIRLFRGLKNAGYLCSTLAVGFGTIISCLDRKGQ